MCILYIMLPPPNFYAGCPSVKYKSWLHYKLLWFKDVHAMHEIFQTFPIYSRCYDIMREAIANCALPIIIFSLFLLYTFVVVAVVLLLPWQPC